MHKIPYVLLLLGLAMLGTVRGQQQPQAFKVTDTTPAVFNGLQMGFSILKQSEKEVGNKGNFSRYSLRFYVTNTTGEAKILLFPQGFTLLNDLSHDVARFDCLNATGARFTNKQVTLTAEACNVLANVEDKDCATNKTQQNNRFVQIGYWVKAGQTIHTDAIMIVPLNEYPSMVVTPVFNTARLVGNAFNAPVNQGIPQQPAFNGPPYVKLKNFWKNTYLNNELGPATCTPIDQGWWSAQWQVIPVNGTNFYNIKNRWKDVYISTEDPASMLSVNYQSRGSMWIVEPVDNTTVRFRNLANNTYLNIEYGSLQSTKLQPDAWSSEWVMEQP